MELRRDPVSLRWILQEDGQPTWPETPCPLCPGHEDLTPQTLYEQRCSPGSWQVRVTPHPHPLYRIEGQTGRQGEGLYDKMRNLGAHEVVAESPEHDRSLSQLSEEHVAEILRAFVARMTDLKKDPRFRYISVFRTHGPGLELDHAHSQIIALPFIPRPLVYELRAAKRHFDLKERCLFCDIVQQEMDYRVRTVDWDEHNLAFCPFASRTPYETWILPLRHHCSFEEDLTAWERQVRLARLLKSILRRIEAVTPAYQLVLHTAPNVRAKFEKLGHWTSLEHDFHWHFEIQPAAQPGNPSYFLPEAYYNSVPPESAARRLRALSMAEEPQR
jgi:UDPglucose--hexose-1-phosphate uridylyltransferase